MKAAWIVVALLAGSAHAIGGVSLSASQADWKNMGSPPEYRWFPFGGPNKIDLKTLSRSGDVVTVWVRSPAEPGPLLQRYPSADRYMLKTHFNCRARSVGQSGLVVYDPAGKNLHTTSTPDYLVDYTPIAPESVGEFQIDLACS